MENDTQEDNSYLDRINKEFGHLVKEKNLLRKQEIDLKQKKPRYTTTPAPQAKTHISLQMIHLLKLKVPRRRM